MSGFLAEIERFATIMLPPVVCIHADSSPREVFNYFNNLNLHGHVYKDVATRFICAGFTGRDILNFDEQAIDVLEIESTSRRESLWDHIQCLRVSMTMAWLLKSLWRFLSDICINAYHLSNLYLRSSLCCTDRNCFRLQHLVRLSLLLHLPAFCSRQYSHTLIPLTTGLSTTRCLLSSERLSTE